MVSNLESDNSDVDYQSKIKKAVEVLDHDTHIANGNQLNYNNQISAFKEGTSLSSASSSRQQSLLQHPFGIN